MAHKPVLAYHVIFCTHGFWLPNDPRGSQSKEVRADQLKAFGPATTVGGRQSVAHLPHNFEVRRLAKKALRYPEVTLSGIQARSIGEGFAEQAAKSRYVIYACSILPCHFHLVIRRHHYSIEQVVRLLRQAGTRHLLDENLHPFKDQRTESGRLPSIWAQDFWKVFRFDEEQVHNSIEYVNENPIKEGKPPQRWSFVTPYEKVV